MNHIIVAKPTLKQPLYVVALAFASPRWPYLCFTLSPLMAIVGSHLHLCFTPPLHHTKLMLCHYCKRNHIVDRLCGLHLVSTSLRPWIFLAVSLPFTLGFYPRFIANLSKKKLRYYCCCKWRFFSYYRRSLHCRYCWKLRVSDLRRTSMIIKSARLMMPLLRPPYSTSTLVRNSNTVLES